MMNEASSKKLGSILVHRAYLSYFKEQFVSILASQLHYWYQPDKQGKSKLRVFREGSWWVVKSHAEWMKECCLSLYQVRKSIEILKRQDVIVATVMKFGGVPTLHVRSQRVSNGDCLQKGESLLDHLIDKPEIPNLCKSSNPFVEEQQIHLSKSSKTYTEDYIKKIKVKEEKLASPNKQATQLDSNNKIKEPPSEKKQNVKIENAGAEVFSHYTSAGSETATIPKTPTQRMEKVWRETVPKFNVEVEIVGTLTLKDRGMLAWLHKAWGEDCALKILEHVCKRWTYFTGFVKDNSDCFKFPYSPAIGYLVKYQDLAKNYWLAYVKKNKVTPPADYTASSPHGSAVQATAALPKKIVAHKEAPATLEEILAIKAEWKGNN